MSNRKSLMAMWMIALGALAAQALHAQNISTYAGGAAYVNAPATSVSLSSVRALTRASDGKLYLADDTSVYRFDPVAGTVTLIAGNGTNGYSGDGGSAKRASLYHPSGVAVDAAGNLYIADSNNNRIRKVTPGGIISTVAGNGTIVFSGDGGPATSASLRAPGGVTVDTAGNLYIADSFHHVVRKVTPDGNIATVAGNGTQPAGYSGDGGPATSATLNDPSGVAVDAAGTLYIADLNNHRIRAVTSGNIATVAGTGINDYTGDGGPATDATLYFPAGVAVDAAGTLYIADSGNSAIRAVTSGNISTVAGQGSSGYSGDGGPATSAKLHSPLGVAVDGAGKLYIADLKNNVIRVVTPDGNIATVAGNGTYSYSGDGGPAKSARLSGPLGIAVDASAGANVYVADANNYVIRAVTSAGIISTVAGNGTPGYTGDGGLATSATLSAPNGVALDAAGNLYIADAGSPGNVVRAVTPAGIISTVAGDGTIGYSGDGGPATSAKLSAPNGVAVDASGKLYIADSNNHVIRAVTPAGIISTVAGNGLNGFSGDGGSAKAASLSVPSGVAVDAGTGNLYIADSTNNRIRVVTPAGIISTVAGNGAGGYSGDGGSATGAALATPSGVAIDLAGNLYIADANNSVIRKVTPGGIISTVAGIGTQHGYSGDGGLATSARLATPSGAAVNSAGDLFIADEFNNRIRKVARVSAEPPAVVAHLTGTLGANGWYTSTVSLTWTLTSNTAIQSNSGCAARSITGDTKGFTYTCSATNVTGTTTRSATIKKDTTAPSASATATPAANANGWHKAAVTVSFSGTDAISGIGSCAANQVLSTSGANQSASGTCTDQAGNVSSPATASGINIDLDRPTVTITTPANGAVYARNSTVNANYACSDALSGVATCTGPVANGAAINTTFKGNKPFRVTSTDLAGNSATTTYTYTVQ